MGYSESNPNMIQPNTPLYRMDEWGMGKKRSFQAYLKMTGIDPVSKKITLNKWCHKGEWPKEAQPYYIENKNK